MTGPPLRPRRRRSEGPRGGPAGTRAARPSRVPLRSRSRGSQILTYAHRIQERDIEILLDLNEHRVLTTRQIRDLIVATRLDLELKQTGFRRDTPKRFAKSFWLDHWVETNDFFCRLAWALRRTGAGSLTEWWGERRCRGLWDLAEPDGLARVATDRGEVNFFFELDRGTENHAQLRAKAEGYADMPLLPDTPRLVLWCFPTPRREAEARRAIQTPGMSVATSVRERVRAEPLGRVWQPLSHPFRMSVLELPRPGDDPPTTGPEEGPR